jgi:hypothetical protein
VRGESILEIIKLRTFYEKVNIFHGNLVNRQKNPSVTDRLALS